MNKTEALMYLESRKIHFINRHKYERVSMMMKFIEDIKANIITEFDFIETIGLDITIPLTEKRFINVKK
jgi:hypothetical protein